MGQRWREQYSDVIEVSRHQILKEAMKRTLNLIQRVLKRPVIRSECSKISLALVWLVGKRGETHGAISWEVAAIVHMRND